MIRGLHRIEWVELNSDAIGMEVKSTKVKVNGIGKPLFDQHHFTSVVYFAAESLVDRSIRSPLEFVETYIKGTVVLLEESREERLIAGFSDSRVCGHEWLTPWAG